MPEVEVVCDPAVMSGEPCIAGTRVLAEIVIANLRAGHSECCIRQAFPALPDGAIDAVVRWAEAAGIDWRRAACREIEEFRDGMLAAVPSARISVEQPRHRPGEWWVTVKFTGFEALLSWAPGRGWGLHGNRGFDAPPWSLYPDLAAAVEDLRGASVAHGP
jgi:uncharacterized protein (DUF433 family)